MNLNEEDLNFLKELANKRLTQEKDGCADPVFWMVYLLLFICSIAASFVKNGPELDDIKYSLSNLESPIFISLKPSI